MSAEVARLAQAIEHFESRQPRDLSPDLLKQIVGIKEGLTKYEPTLDSPGKREAIKAAGGTPGTGVSYRDAAKGADAPSPGQKEAARAQKAATPSDDPVTAERARELISNMFTGATS